MATATQTTPHPILLAGRWVDSPDTLVVANPADPANPAGATYNATEAQYEEAVQAAVAAFEQTRKLPAYERGASTIALSHDACGESLGWLFEASRRERRRGGRQRQSGPAQRPDRLGHLCRRAGHVNRGAATLSGYRSQPGF